MNPPDWLMIVILSLTALATETVKLRVETRITRPRFGSWTYEKVAIGYSEAKAVPR